MTQINEYKIDWLSVSLQLQDSPTMDYTWKIKHDCKAIDLLGEIVEPEAPRIAHYTHATKYRYGTLYTCENNREQKRLIVMTGDDWTTVAIDGVKPNVLLSTILALPEANVTRIDFAIDVRNSGGKIAELEHEWNAGKIKTSVKTVTPYGKLGKGGEDLGSTMYFGGRESERFMRVYDKAKQQGIEGDWLRIEIECKGRWAREVAKRLSTGDIIEVGKMAIRQFVNCDLEWYRNATYSGKTGEYITPEARPETNHERWLREVCVPAVLTAIAGNDMLWVEDTILKAILAKHRGEGD